MFLFCAFARKYFACSVKREPMSVDVLFILALSKRRIWEESEINYAEKAEIIGCDDNRDERLKLAAFKKGPGSL